MKHVRRHDVDLNKCRDERDGKVCSTAGCWSTIVREEKTRDRLVPYCMFTDPALARVGLNETEAKARGIAYRLGTLRMSAVLRTRTLSEPRGFMKMLIDGDSDRILGFTVFGAEASEPMAVVQTAMLGRLPFTALRDALFTHPTAAEGLTVLLANVS